MTVPLFLVPIVVGLITQLLKSWLNPKELKLQLKKDGHLPRYGGMPSAHTAFAFSLATVVAWSDGLMSSSFAIAAVVLIFILDDALRMRIFLGRHGQALRKLIRQLPPEQRKGFPHLEARLGHKPLEVVAGAIVGTVLTVVIMWLLSVA